MKRMALAAAILATTFSVAALAQEERKEKHPKMFYLGASLSMANFGDSQYQGDDKPDSTLLGGIVGFQPLNFLAIEGREYVRVSDRDERIKWYASVVSKWLIPIDYHFNIFGTAGYAGVKKDMVGDDDVVWAPTFGGGLRFRNNTPLMLDLEAEYLHEDSVAPAGDDGVISFNINVYYAF
ncbi:hypothetical protein EK599_09750 [Vibrio sp. T187]|uniref:outer membrane beta-barrel protein n=1 Tax=Vibrio TaxID=662 RepID=UPI0010C96B01|nr:MULTISPECIES: outer membrane beta-barrel protein [Vibrio]MBW3695980.1 hypothetical protein [Vibrio sp. T187]